MRSPVPQTQNLMQSSWPRWCMTSNGSYACSNKRRESREKAKLGSDTGLRRFQAIWLMSRASFCQPRNSWFRRPQTLNANSNPPLRTGKLLRVDVELNAAVRLKGDEEVPLAGHGEFRVKVVLA